MGKIIGYSALHYGKEYLAWAMRSVEPFVDEFHILYAKDPSYGFLPDTPGLKCPDTRQELFQESHRFVKKPVFWHDGNWKNEIDHRDEITKITKGQDVDLIIVVDHDEVWYPQELKLALERTMKRTEHVIRIRQRHLWRSFHWTCDEQCMPVRFVRPKGSGEWYLSPQDYPVYHFAYAQCEFLTKYKMEIHGHKRDIRKTWFEDTFKRWTPQNPFDDVHPHHGNHQFSPRPISDMDKAAIAELMYDHPYMKLDLIR
jgi:hypothetical protein